MLEGRRIVLVEDDKIMGASLEQRLMLEGAEVQWHRRIGPALPAIRTPRKSLDAVICDIRLPDGTGEDLYGTLTRTSQPPPFLFITGQGGIDQAVRLIRSGAADYIVKPFDIGAFLMRLATVMSPRADRGLQAQTGITDAARAVDRQVIEAAAHDSALFIRGGPGLGKTRLARRVHELSDGRAAPLIECNALRDRIGADALRAAAGDVGEGSLILIGIEQLDLPAQDALMEMMTATSFRLIATAGFRIEERAIAHRFRADLLALLRSHEIVVPALGDRPEDAVWLAARLFPGFNARRIMPLSGIAATTDEAIRSHDWPGNGRELRARLMRAVMAAEGEMVLIADLFPERAVDQTFRSLSEVRDSAEKAQIAAALDRTQGQVGETARLLRVSRTTLWEKMQKLGI